MEPIAVTITRGEVVESRHRVHAVAVKAGRIVQQAGDARLVTFMRSSAKPLQALPLARARPDLDARVLAVACASHLANEEQLAAVRALLAAAPAGEHDLECGPAGHPPERIKHNCSGKHAGMLALARARGWPTAGYRLPEHAVQQTMLEELAAAAEVRGDDVGNAVDGCGVVTFALSLDRMAHAFSRLEHLDEGDRVAAAMRAHPELIRGPGAPDTTLMQTAPGWTAKGGAEGLLCAAGPDRTGVAMKVEDGNGRAVGAALGSFLSRLGVVVDALASTPVLNSRGQTVGRVTAQA